MLLLLAIWCLLQETPSILSPTAVAIVTAIFTVIVGAVGAVYLKDKVNGNSRIKGLIAGLFSAYGIIAPFISNFPRSYGVAVAVIGLIVTLFSGRVQGQEPEEMVKEAKKAS